MDNTFRVTRIPTIRRMHWLAAKKIFDPSFTVYEEAELDMGIDWWSHQSNLDPNDRAELKRIVNALIAAEENYPAIEQARFFIKKFGFKWWNYFRAGLPYLNGAEPYRGEPSPN